ncbi:hypothetical protein D3C76_1149400 [compost metagenome]
MLAVGVFQIDMHLQSAGKTQCQAGAQLASRAGQIIVEAVVVDADFIVVNELVGQGATQVRLQLTAIVQFEGFPHRQARFA